MTGYIYPDVHLAHKEAGDDIELEVYEFKRYPTLIKSKSDVAKATKLAKDRLSTLYMRIGIEGNTPSLMSKAHYVLRLIHKLEEYSCGIRKNSPALPRLWLNRCTN